MKLAVFVLITIAATAGAFPAPFFNTWMPRLDARPEALILGAGLLLLASILRRRLPH
jgi:hypothetical protein